MNSNIWFYIAFFSLLSNCLPSLFIIDFATSSFAGRFTVLLLLLLFWNTFYCCSSTVVSIFTSSWPPAPPIPTSHPRTYRLWLCPCVLYICSLMVLSLCSPIITSSPIPSGYCQFVLHFNVSGYIFLACLFCSCNLF